MMPPTIPYYSSSVGKSAVKLVFSFMPYLINLYKYSLLT